MLPHRDYYERRLPHLQPLLGTFFVTYRLVNTIPADVFVRFQEERQQSLRLTNPIMADEINRRYFGRYDTWLDRQTAGENHLAKPEIAQLVADSLHFFDGNRIELIAYCIMSNHVHAVFTLLSEKTNEGAPNSLSSLKKSLKGFTAKEANRLLYSQGQFWASEWYDRCVRDDNELVRIVRYVLNNPVKAGLCADWHDWPWSYVKAEYDMF
jgi:putative transposase